MRMLTSQEMSASRRAARDGKSALAKKAGHATSSMGRPAAGTSLGGLNKQVWRARVRGRMRCAPGITMRNQAAPGSLLPFAAGVTSECGSKDVWFSPEGKYLATASAAISQEAKRPDVRV